MKNIKKLIAYTILALLVLLIAYISYFEFIYRSNLISYFKIPTENVTAIKIIEHNFTSNKQTNYAITTKDEISKFISELGNHPIKRKVYQDFKFHHGVPVKTICSSLYSDYMIMIESPTNTYNFTITQGKSIIANLYSRSNLNNSSVLFDIIGEPFQIEAPKD